MSRRGLAVLAALWMTLPALSALGAPSLGHIRILPEGSDTHVAGIGRVIYFTADPPGETLKPAAEYRTNATGPWHHPLQPDQELLPGYELRTATNGSVLLQVSRRGFLQLRGNSHLRLDGGQKRKSFAACLYAGIARFVSPNPEELVVQTPSATASKVHSDFEMIVSAIRTEVTVFEGGLTFSNTAGALDLDALRNPRAWAQPGQSPQPLEARNIVQWWIHYPVVLNPRELALDPDAHARLQPSLRAYEDGRWRDALSSRPGPEPESATDAERIYAAALRLVAGDVVRAEELLDRVGPDHELAQALRWLIAAVRHQDIPTPPEPSTSTGWLALSYLHQSQHRLDDALSAARKAVSGDAVRSRFGAAWLRVAELELGREAWVRAREALDEGLRWSPDHPARAALEGFLLLAEGRPSRALPKFQETLRLDPAFADGWFGQGLSRIAAGARAEGIEDLEVAVALAPERSLLRSYLGKALALEGNWAAASNQLARARQLDPSDPTPWLYQAVFDHENNLFNPAITNLNKALEQNQNQVLFRSREQLDGDEAVRRANLAFLYGDAGLLEWGRWEAARSTALDYANSDAHLFLAQTYASLTDPFRSSLRYETAAASEYLLASLLAPAAAAQLSPLVAFARPTEFFAGRTFEVIAAATMRDPGGFVSVLAHQGHLGRTAYATDYSYTSIDRGPPNTHFEQQIANATVKQQISPRDGLYLLVQGTATESGDVRLYREPDDADPTLRVSEDQWPNLVAGYHRHWSPGQDTVATFGLLSDTIAYNTRIGALRLIRTDDGIPVFVSQDLPFDTQYDSDFRLWSGEAQHLARHRGGLLLAGVRLQAGDLDTRSRLQDWLGATGGILEDQILQQQASSSLRRASLYAYEHLDLHETLQLSLGLAFDDLEYPRQESAPPVDVTLEHTSQLSPKAGFLWTPRPGTDVRGVYTRSLGGFSFDSSVRLEPTHLQGFVQAFRSLVPESVAANAPGTEFETLGLQLSQRVGRRLYLTASAEELRSQGTARFGALQFETDSPQTARALAVPQELDYRESRCGLTLNLLEGRDWSFAAGYALSWTRLDSSVLTLATLRPEFEPARHRVDTHEIGATARWQHPSGVFAQLAGTWVWQDNGGADAGQADEYLAQFDALVGFRSPRRAAILALGVLNITGEDYRFNPLGSAPVLPRERTLAASLSLSLW